MFYGFHNIAPWELILLVFRLLIFLIPLAVAVYGLFLLKSIKESSHTTVEKLERVLEKLKKE